MTKIRLFSRSPALFAQTLLSEHLIENRYQLPVCSVSMNLTKRSNRFWLSYKNIHISKKNNILHVYTLREGILVNEFNSILLNIV